MNELPEEESLKQIMLAAMFGDERAHDLTMSERAAKAAHDHYAPIIAEKDKEIEKLVKDWDETTKKMNGMYSQITDLQKKVAELEAANEWVSVEDRLPEKSGAVLCFTVNDDIWLCQHFVVSGDFQIKGTYVNEHITHWKPLPKAPTT